MQIQYNGKSKILRRIVALVNRSQNVALRQDNTDKNTLYWTGLDGVEITVNIPSGAVEVDTELSETSTNPVENQAITKELAQKADKSAIPTVGDGVLSVQRNGKSVGTFSANAAKDTAVNISVPEKVSELENDAGYGTYTKPAAGIPKSDLASGVQASLGKADTALQKHQDISGKLDKTGDASNTTVAFSAASARENVKTGEKLSVILGKIAKWFADLKTVAFTGSYNDLSDKPTIPDVSGKQDKLTAGTNITISGSTISAKDTTYTSKSAVSGGTDVSLVTTGEKAIWNAKTSNVGTITGIKMNGASKGTSGVVDLGTVITAHQDISGKQDNSTAVTHSANTAAGSATKPVYVDANGVATAISHSINSDVPANAKFTDTTYNDATQSTHGLMTAEDKKKLDGIAAGATKVAVDSALSATSTNPVQNKAVKAALDSKSASDHTHAMITNSAVWIAGANNAAKWYRLGVLVSSGNFSNAVIRVWSGDGANGRANQNSSFEVQIKDGWQSTESATKACAVTVYRINCSSVKVKVIPTAHDTYTVWVYLPWTYWNGNYAVYGKYKSWTSQQLIQSEEPEGTGADTAYYDHAFLTSTVAKATEATTLTDSGWIDTTRNTSFTATSTVKCRKYGQLVEVRGEVTFNSTYGSPTVCTLPAGYRPATVVQACGITPSGKQYMIKADTSGVISFGSDSGSTFVKGTTYRVDLTYLLG